MRRTPVHSLTQNGGERRVLWPGCPCRPAWAWSSFIPLLQAVSSMCKTRNQLLRPGHDLLSLSRLNHGQPRGQAHPEIVQGATDFHHDITDALFPEADPVFDDAAALLRWP